MRTSVLVAVLSLIPMSFAHAQIPTAERDALIALYNSTDGANWTDSTGWLGAAGTECTWHGVTCDEVHVTRLSLASNQLSGSIPAELANLEELSRLYLGSNQLSGGIPPQLGNLSSSLTVLDLGSNQLSGSIPPELGNLWRLTNLNLGGNQLTGSIPPHGNLQLSRYLHQLSGSIPGLGNLST